ncbi:ceramide transfer protein isoform X2 [Vespula pensylvanica]|uniref:ceramide transfer protein isoform X2 n=1 Tax=Vespula pensylvanica TaxID=30213 RepID=UPI001CBA0CE7|nr:ceramide transfer protein isoform X2 [Vespula pensylvanica]XP_050869786.1 ceramide transfer protein isoform X2 [Vespula vulgaris]
MADEVEALRLNNEEIEYMEAELDGDDDDGSDGVVVPELQGTLSKWTNYIHGWQTRFIVLKDGTLSYYKSEQDSGFGCRGSISLYKANIKAHEFDECRFDVSVNDCLVWYLRASNPEEKQRWVDVLKSYKEGPHSALCDEEFYDAVETGLDKIDEENQLRDRLKQKSVTILTTPTTSAVKHRLWPEIEKITMQQLHYARLGVGGAGGWQLFAEDGDMRMYRREEEADGLVVDPLKACHVVKGVTGHEVCEIFFGPEYRSEWEATLEDMTVIENISKDTLVFLQTHKRIWPASQRDALFWSHIRRVTDDQDPDAHDLWIVCNHSTEYSDYPSNVGKCVRVYLTVCLVCQTFIDPPKDEEEIKRENITCKITYCSVVNPGGWAPASVLRAVYKREYPKFLKRFTNFCIEQCKNKPITF